MLDKAKAFKGYRLQSLDGRLGCVKGSYFDDHHWTLRYLVADTGAWLADRLVLISPHSIAAVNNEERYFAVDLTSEQIERGPARRADEPMSLQFEEAYCEHYDWPTYWKGPFAWGAFPYIKRNQGDVKGKYRGNRAWEHQLRSSSDVSDFHIQGADGEIGRVEDLVIDDETWAIRYLIIDTRNWWPLKKALIAPKWINRVAWDESKVFLDLSCDAIKSSPEYADAFPPTREYEIGLYRYYDRQGYWADGNIL